ncbi:MAG: MBL fold metallo-hydrolase [Enterobacteriaceae bacterium]
MKLHFLGTAASEGFPNPFCRCAPCQQARLERGKNLRTHSSVLIDQTMLIDLSPTFSQQLLRDDIDAFEITELLFTHTHPDHFNVGELYSRMEGFAYDINQPLHIFGNDRAINGCLQTLPGYTPQRFVFHCLIPFVTVESHGYRITPLLANHAKWELCYVYHIEKNGKSLFYGHDSGWFPDLTWQWLADNARPLDMVVLECTYGFNGNPRCDNHMSLETVFAAQQKLAECGCLDDNSQLFVSHISHSGKMLHDELSTLCREKNITVAFDGLIATC